MDHETRSLINRWKSIQGHARAVEKMLEDDAYCVDVLKQTLAIQGAIERVNAGVLERHLKTCVTTAIASEDLAEREQVIAELMDVFKGTGHLRRVASASEAIERVAASLGDAERQRHGHGNGEDA
jgi:DNA-binding FrmR family transcriptional regulator